MLAINSRSEYCVWCDPNCSDAERFAAEELSRYMREITGARWALWAENAAPPKAILVGASPMLVDIGIDLAGEALGGEGFIIRTVGERIAISGATGSKRGTLYGVYTFLEDVLGCRWYAPSVSRIPHRPTLGLPELSIRQAPELEYRETYYQGIAPDGEWSAHNKNNGHFPRLRAHQGGQMKYQPFVHTFESLLPAAEYFDTHPEYFSMVDGQRIRERTQLCLTNPEVKRIALERVREWMRANPDATIFSVSQNDCFNPCQCPECRALDEAEGSHMGSLLHFVNYIAENIADEFPHAIIDTLAYQYTRVPPRHVTPRENVCVRLCSIECCFAHPLEACNVQCSFGNEMHGDSFQADLAGWAKLSKRLYIWDYVVNYSHFLMPFPNLDVLAPNIRYFIRNNVKGIFEEGATSFYGGLEFEELRAWLLAKLLWNPYQDVWALTEDFVSGYYGAAARFVMEYIRLIHRKKNESPESHFGLYDPPHVRFITDEVITEAEALFDAAECMAESPEVLERVRIARLPIRYWALLNLPTTAPGRAEAIDRFAAGLRARNIMQISEGRALDFSIEQLRKGIALRFQN